MSAAVTDIQALPRLRLGVLFFMDSRHIELLKITKHLSINTYNRHEAQEETLKHVRRGNKFARKSPKRESVQKQSVRTLETKIYMRLCEKNGKKQGKPPVLLP